MNGKRVDLQSIKRDLARESAGQWVPFNQWRDADGSLIRDVIAFLVLPNTDPAYQAAWTEMTRRLAEEFKGAEIPNDRLQAELGALYAEHLLRGWRGLSDDYNAELAEALLPDPEWRALYNAVAWCCEEAARVKARMVDAAVKNSAAPSVTS